VWKWRVTTDPLPSENEPATQGEAVPHGAQVLRSQDPAGPHVPLEFPPRRSVLAAKLLGLFVVSVLSGFSILARVVDEAKVTGQPLIGWILGLLVACAAVAAPWLVVLDEMRSGSIESRTIDALSKMVQDTEDASNALLKSANKADELADGMFLRGEGMANTAQDKYDRRRLEAENIILTARSLHTSTGRYALEEGDMSASPEARDVLAPLFTLDTSQLYKAMERMRKLRV
jgi:predicted outer membrane lipoprotein